jgi:hypothetical protein
MRRLTKVIAAELLTSCVNRSAKDKEPPLPNESKFVTTTLRDSLGTVSFAIPARFDTSFTWTNESDCGKSCNREQYRFQPKSLPVFKESGFFTPLLVFFMALVLGPHQQHPAVVRLLSSYKLCFFSLCHRRNMYSFSQPPSWNGNTC